MEKKKILEFQNISKSFVGVKALSDVSFSVREGEVHALLGENGAGKSTLMKILSGAYMRDAGKVFLDGQEIQVKNTKESERLGISIIYQELNLIPELSVAENIFLDRQPKRNGFIDWKQMNQDAEKILEGIDMKIPPKMIVSTLSVAQRQMVEIAKAVSLGARLVIMDEPTSTLTEGETRKFAARSLMRHAVRASASSCWLAAPTTLTLRSTMASTISSPATARLLSPRTASPTGWKSSPPVC